MNVCTLQVIWGIPAQSSLTTAPAVVPLVYLSLPPSKHRWVTAAILLPILQSSHSSATSSTEYSSQWIVCGDRKGSIHVYQIDFHREISQVRELQYPMLYRSIFCQSIAACTVGAVTAWCSRCQWSDPHHTEEWTRHQLWQRRALQDLLCPAPHRLSRAHPLQGIYR